MEKQITMKPSKFIRVTNSLDWFFYRIGLVVRKALLKHAENNNIKHKGHIWKNTSLTVEERAGFTNVYGEYHGKVKDWWHRLYKSYTGNYDPAFFPEYLFTTKLELRENPYTLAGVFGDKNLLQQLFGSVENIHIPTTYASCVNGKLRDSETHYISKDALFDRIKDVGFCVIKKTLDTSSGRDVVVCNIVNGYDVKNDISLSELLDLFGDNYVIQEKIQQHPIISALNSSSINTFRVMTYLLNDRVNICPVLLRIGRNGKEIDNAHGGVYSLA